MKNFKKLLYVSSTCFLLSVCVSSCKSTVSDNTSNTDSIIEITSSIEEVEESTNRIIDNSDDDVGNPIRGMTLQPDNKDDGQFGYFFINYPVSEVVQGTNFTTILPLDNTRPYGRAFYKNNSDGKVKLHVYGKGIDEIKYVDAGGSVEIKLEISKNLISLLDASDFTVSIDSEETDKNLDGLFTLVNSSKDNEILDNLFGSVLSSEAPTW